MSLLGRTIQQWSLSGAGMCTIKGNAGTIATTGTTPHAVTISTGCSHPISAKRFHRHFTGWFTYKSPNLFPGECPRRFLHSDHEVLHTSSMFHCEYLTCRFLLFFGVNFRHLRIFGKCGPPYAKKIRRKKKTEVRSRDGHVERVCKSSGSIKNDVDIWIFVRKHELRYVISFKLLGSSVGSSFFARFCLLLNTGGSDLRLFARKKLQTCLAVPPTGSCKMRRIVFSRLRLENA